LRDNGEDRDVTVDDASKGKFNDIKEVTHTDSSYRKHRYRIYRYPDGEKPVTGQHKGYVVKYSGSLQKAPVSAFGRENGEIVVDLDTLVHQLVQEYGEGQFYVYKFGGNPEQETVFKGFVEVI